MTTLTIEDDVKLSINNFKTYDDLVNFIIYDNTHLEITKMDDKETNFLNSLDSFKNLKNVANSIGK